MAGDDGGYFFCSLAGGMMLALGLGCVEGGAHRFVRVVGLIAFASIASVAVWAAMGGAGYAGAAPGFATILSLTSAASAAVITLAAPVGGRNVAAMRRWAALLGGTTGMGAACCWAACLPPMGVARSWLWIVPGQCIGSFLLGSVTVAWLLGSAYLTATSMTIAPLRRASRLFSIAVALRWVYLLVIVGVAYLGASQSPGDSLPAKLGSLWLILSLRVAVGLVAVALFAYMVADCVRLRSTQSATGILYFASVFVYIGELCSQYLLTESGLPM